MLQLPVQTLAALPPNHDVRYILRQILVIAASAGEQQRTPLMMSQKIVQLLYKTPSALGREVYVTLLDQLCQAFEDVGKEAITWLLYAEDEVCNAYHCQMKYINPFLAQVQCLSHSDPAPWGYY